MVNSDMWLDIRVMAPYQSVLFSLRQRWKKKIIKTTHPTWNPTFWRFLKKLFYLFFVKEVYCKYIQTIFISQLWPGHDCNAIKPLLIFSIQPSSNFLLPVREFWQLFLFISFFHAAVKKTGVLSSTLLHRWYVNKKKLSKKIQIFGWVP